MAAALCKAEILACLYGVLLALVTDDAFAVEREYHGFRRGGMLISAVHEHDGKEELHLLMLDDNIPAGFRLC